LGVDCEGRNVIQIMEVLLSICATQGIRPIVDINAAVFICDATVGIGL